MPYKSIYTFLLCILPCLISSLGIGQNSNNTIRRKCGTDEFMEGIYQKHPGMKEKADKTYRDILNYVNSPQFERRRGTMYRIPVVVHVMHNGGFENISDAQIKSQIKSLNEDYRKISGTKGDGAGVDTEIEFALASIDPEGNFTTGINRIKTSKTYHDKANDQDLKALSRWEPSKYLNIWIVKSITPTGILGYAFKPIAGTSPAMPSPLQDGLVIRSDAFGTTGTIVSPSRYGRTASHEIGHYLGLPHPWGSTPGDCTDDDGISDTPNCTGEYYSSYASCPNPNQCGNVRQIENYMDYSDDGCMSMFTQGQSDVMRTVISQLRSGLVSSTNLNATGTTFQTAGLDAGLLAYSSPANNICSDLFTPKVVLKNYGTEPITSVDIILKINFLPVDTVSFSGNLLENEMAEIIFKEITLSSSGSQSFSASTSNLNNGATDLSILNNSASKTFTVAKDYGDLPFLETFEGSSFPPDNWIRVNLNNNANKWSRYASGGFGQSSYSAQMDNYSGASNVGHQDYLLTPKFDLTNINNPVLKFNVAYAPFKDQAGSEIADRLNVFISSDCNNDYTNIYSKTDPTIASGNLPTAPSSNTLFVPSASQWRAESISLNAYKGLDYVRFKFENVSSWGNAVYIDDVEIDGDIILKNQDVIENHNLFSLYPNPTQDKIELNFHARENVEVSIILFDSKGSYIEKVHQGIVSNKTISISLNELVDGLYFVVLHGDGIHQAVPVLKTR